MKRTPKNFGGYDILQLNGRVIIFFFFAVCNTNGQKGTHTLQELYALYICPYYTVLLTHTQNTNSKQSLYCYPWRI